MNLKPDWNPTKEIIKNSNIFKMMQKFGFDNYSNFWKWSVSNKEIFWEETLQNLNIHLNKKYTAF